MIPRPILEDLRSSARALIAELDAAPTWLGDVVEAYNATVRAGEDLDTAPCNPLLTRLLFDRVYSRPITVPAITRLLRYFKRLPEFSDSAWNDRRARVLGEDFASFHSALTEISLHLALSKVPGLGVRFIDIEPGRRKRPDYQLTFRDGTLEAELKSIFSARVRAPSGARFVGSLDGATAQAAWRKFTEPYREGQLDSAQSSAVFVDITLCDELFLFLAIPTAFPGFGLRNHARELLQQLAAARPSASQPNNFFLTCGFDPDSLGLLFLAPVP